MKLTILDRLKEPFFSRSDFSCFLPETHFSIVRLNAKEGAFDGSIFSQIPKDTTHLITWFVDRFSEVELQRLPDLRYIGLAYTGWYDKYFDKTALQNRRVVVCNNAQYAPNAVAEAVIAVLLSRYRGLTSLSMGDPTFRPIPGRELRSKTLGIIGLGAIGERLSQIAIGLGLHVVSTSKKLCTGVEQVEKAQLLARSDIVSLHIPKSAGSVIDENDFSKLKHNAVIVNTSGWENLDTGALLSFLSSNPTAAYLYLAMPTEEYFSKLSELQNAYLYPLFSSSTEESIALRKSVTVENLRSFMAGKNPPNRVI